MVQQDNLCYNCLAFKSRIITTQNIYRLKFDHSGLIRKKLKREGIVRIYYCYWNLLQRDVYVTESRVRKLKKKDCEYRNRLSDKEDYL